MDEPDAVPALMARHLPGYGIDSIARLGHGLDNVGYLVNDDLVVRINRDPDAAQRAETVRREADCLAVVGELSPLPVPEPVFVDPDAGAIAYRKLAGVPLLDRPVADPARLAGPLAEFLTRIHRPPRPARRTLEALLPGDDEPLLAWRDEAEAAYRSGVDLIPAASRRPVEAFLAASPPAEPTEPTEPTFCHADLGAEHLLADSATGQLTGVIDWTDAAFADPAQDFARIFRDFGPDVLDRTVADYAPGPAGVDRARVVFYARCALLADIGYGVESGDDRYVRAALASLPHTFAD